MYGAEPTSLKKTKSMSWRNLLQRKSEKRRKKNLIYDNIIDLLIVKGITAYLKKVECEWRGKLKKKKNMFGYRENTRKINKRKKIE